MQPDEGVQIRRGYGLPGELRLQVGGHDVAAAVHEMPLEHVPAQGVVDVVDGPAVFHHQLDDGVGAFLHGGHGGVLLDEVLHLFPHHLLHQGGQILEVVIKRIAVNAAVLHDILHGDLAQRPLVEQLEEGFLNCPPGKICHRRHLLENSLPLGYDMVGKKSRGIFRRGPPDGQALNHDSGFGERKLPVAAARGRRMPRDVKPVDFSLGPWYDTPKFKITDGNPFAAG